MIVTRAPPIAAAVRLVSSGVQEKSYSPVSKNSGHTLVSIFSHTERAGSAKITLSSLLRAEQTSLLVLSAKGSGIKFEIEQEKGATPNLLSLADETKFTEARFARP